MKNKSLLINRIDKLIKKLTPQSIIFNESGWAICPVCHKIIGDDNYCKHCGQKLKP